MVILYAQVANPGSTIGALLVDTSLAISDAWHWRRPYNCPYAGSECTVIGDIPYLVAHLKDDHKVDMHSGSTFNHRYVKSNPQEVENATWMLTVFSCFGQYFCLHFEAFQLGMAPVYIAFLRFMGDDNEAKNYSYSLEVGGNGRKMTWQGVPRSIRDSHRKVRDSFDGLIIQRNMALFFCGGDRKELKLRAAAKRPPEEQGERQNSGSKFNTFKKVEVGEGAFGPWMLVRHPKPNQNPQTKGEDQKQPSKNEVVTHQRSNPKIKKMLVNESASFNQ
ncbi:E3 ubiquitin-protein ligase DIS1-like isoform X2 [Senna tora]|uniref:E3 ubiquitin-protein ligase DIS1-like isoform X2 n=1 Tax=Senna tora TaxID=362788 RepID=A0A834X1E5_9FABA|nr:E3 ubiquitin-protein ligase DIS1-like isoform X2 [Senna tora]